MQGGNLRKRVLIQQRASTVEGTFGQQSLIWVNLTTIWADIEVVSGAQLARSQSIYNMTTHHIITRFQKLFADMKKVGSYRAVYTTYGSTRYFDIGATLNDAERNRMVTLLCSEGLNDGQ
ncbi:phage head closure protein [Rhodoferax sp. GW822-FHT02A01]|uniref:phage head closure protein n=1 Tax=Rhodoferax sp. GW822-FHT02A01 TaxID=3141537 RepID=UPI00315DDA51